MDNKMALKGTMMSDGIDRMSDNAPFKTMGIPKDNTHLIVKRVTYNPVVP